MADQKQLELLQTGVDTWNRWREENLEIDVDLSGADLEQANLRGANLQKIDLSEARLCKADLREADLCEAYLNKANLSEADFTNANLTQANLSQTVLYKANLSGAQLCEADLRGSDLRLILLNSANLCKANLSGVILREADLSESNLSEADLTAASLVHTNFTGANLNRCNIFGVSAWELKLDETRQSDLIISPYGEPIITVDNLEIAQFIYLLLHNKKVRQAIDTITSKVVLILGRFTPERKVVLDAIREELRQHNYVPIMFDFDRPTERDFTETIMTLAGMCRFVIADITNPSSSPLELQATVPNYMVPLVPIIQVGERPFAMFRDLYGKYDWVLAPLEYRDEVDLVEVLDRAVIEPALEKHHELVLRKAQALPHRKTDDYRRRSDA